MMSGNYATPDVRQLHDDQLATADFPTARGEDFRVHFAANIHESIVKHASEDVSVEICGVLVGKWQQDADGPFAAVTEFIRCDMASSGFAEVTFTHEAWSKINTEMDTKFSDLRIVGWYHSHPDFGIFLSDRDCFIQENFFSGAGQIAHVVDPVRKIEGVFVWHQGKPVKCRHYWIGDRIYSPVADDGPPKALAATADQTVNVASSPQLTRVEDINWMTALRGPLIYCGIFLIGYLLAGLKTSWERRMLVEGTAAHFATMNIVRPKLKNHLEMIDTNLKLLSSKVAELAVDHVKFAGDDAAETKKAWKNIRLGINAVREVVSFTESEYCLTEEEAAVAQRVLTSTLAGFDTAPSGKGPRQQADASPINKKTKSKQKQKSAEPKKAGPEPYKTPSKSE